MVQSKSAVLRAGIGTRYHSKKLDVTVEERMEAFGLQYCELYRARLNALKQRVISSRDDGKKLYRQLDALRDGETCLIVGIVAKWNGLRLLKDVASDDHKIPEKDSEEEEQAELSFVMSGEALALEDEKQTIKLTGKVTNSDVATGCVIGCIGKKGSQDDFIVEELVYPSVVKQEPSGDGQGSIAIISGLDLSGEPKQDAPTIAAMNLFSRWIGGQLAQSTDNIDKASQKALLIVAGGCIKPNGHNDVASVTRPLRGLPREAPQVPPEVVEGLDHVLSMLSVHLEVDLVPGCGDPTNHMWPQQPIHNAMLPSCTVPGTGLSLCHNPYLFQNATHTVLVTSGDNVTDVMRQCSQRSSLDVMEAMLRWQHVAPTAPSTLPGFPFKSRDPLILRSRPHVFICGNQERFESRWVNFEDNGDRCLLIAVPKFSRSRLVVTLNLQNYEIGCQAFDI